MNADEFGAWYVSEALAAMDERCEVERVEPDPADSLPACVVEYLARLVYLPKREYAAAFARFVWCGAPVPELTTAEDRPEWCGKVEAKLDRMYGKGGK